MAVVAGVISDTHGLLRKEAVDALRGVSLIIHAGDVGSPDILDALEQIAPVHGVRGNIDVDSWAQRLPETLTVEIGQARVFVIHNVADLDFDPAQSGYAAVISGHSHRAKEEMRNGVLYLNPGSAGPRRFRLPITLALLTEDNGALLPEFISL
jgi:putative phosphoesterase